MRRHRLLSLLFAFILLAGAAAPARCAGQPTVVCETGTEGGAISLSLEDLDGSDIYGVQVELVLSGEYPDCAFIPSSQTAYSPDCRVESLGGSTVVTVYLTDRAALNKGGALDLGKLDLGGSQPAGRDILPDTASVILLDLRLRPMTGAMSGELPVKAAAPAGTEPTYPGDVPWAPGPGGSTTSPGTSGTSDTSEPPVDADSSEDPGLDKDEEPGLPVDTTEPATLPFADVAAESWYRGAVEYVYAHAIMSGTEANQFSPDQDTTRGMIVTMLHRLEGSPAALPAAFSDVPAGAYYAEPVAWASVNSIVTGIGDGLFSPESAITREQMAAILYRYAQYKGLDTAARADLSQFPDASTVSSYAAEPMSWAVSVGLIAGSDGRLDPGGNATRAQVATIFQRLCVNLLGMA